MKTIQISAVVIVFLTTMSIWAAKADTTSTLSGHVNNHDITTLSLHPLKDGDHYNPNRDKASIKGKVGTENESGVFMPVSSLEYLHFSVDKFYNADNEELIELPEQDFSYLKFDIDSINESYNRILDQLPGAEGEFDYLRFDVNKYTNHSETGCIPADELPVAE